MLKLIGSFVWGAILGAAAVLLHSAYMPFGLLLSLIGSGLGIWSIGRAWGMRRFKVFAAVGWALVILRGGTSGVGGELLVQGNVAGNTLVIAGFAMLLLSVGIKA